MCVAIYYSITCQTSSALGNTICQVSFKLHVFLEIGSLFFKKKYVGVVDIQSRKIIRSKLQLHKENEKDDSTSTDPLTRTTYQTLRNEVSNLPRNKKRHWQRKMSTKI